ncbi:MAG: tetratricopeptide repeat protein [Candidatus Eisenbacteria bacterium]
MGSGSLDKSGTGIHNTRETGDIGGFDLASSRSKPNIYILLLCVFGVAIALRIIYLSHLRGLPFFDHPIMDASYHDTWAREIAGGSLSRGEPFYRAPLYSYLLALIYSISGGSYLLPRIIQFALGGLTAVITFSLTRRLMGLTAGAVAGLLCAVYPVLIYFDGELLTETLFIFLTMLGILLIDTARSKQKLLLWLSGGLALGLSLITRPTIALFLPLAVAGSLVVSRRRIAAALLLIAGIAIPVLPVAIHNYAVSGEFIPVVWQGGINLYLGNNPAADGWSATSPEIRKDWWGGYRDMIAIPRSEMQEEPTFNQVSAYWSDKAFEYMRRHPADWSRLMLKKSALFWGSLEFPNNQDYSFMKLNSWVLRNPIVNFGTVAPLAILGVFLLLGARRRLLFPYAFLLAYFAATVAFFVCSRYRAPALPVLCIFAGGAVASLVDLWKTRRVVTLSVCLVALAGLALLVNTNLTGERLPDLAQSYTQVGKVCVERGDDTAAAEYFSKALEVNPAWGEAYEQLGLLKMKVADKEAAKELLTRATQVQPDMATAFRSLAMLELATGDPEAARRAIAEALRLAPYLEDSHNILGSIQRQEGDLDGAIMSFARELELNPDNWRALANLGSAHDENGDLDAAVEAYSRAVELNPEDADIAYALAGLYSKMGEHGLARSVIEGLGAHVPQDVNLSYNRAVILQRDGHMEEAGTIYESILSKVPSHEGALVNLGVVYARSGQAEQARELWLRALEVNPSNETARRNLELLDRPD